MAGMNGGIRSFRLRRLALGLGLAVGLTACGGSAPRDPLADVDPTGQEVEFWYQYTDSREAVLLDLIDLFNATNPYRIQVKGDYVGSHADIYNRMLRGIHGGPLPDLVVAYQNQATIYYQAREVVDLTPYMRSAKWGLTADELADYFPSFIQQDNLDGVQTGFLPNRSMEMLYYNADWLRELGCDEPPRDWTRFEAICRQAAAQPFSRSLDRSRSLGFELALDASRLASMVFSRGGDILNPTGTAYTLDTPQMRAALTMLRDLVQARAAAFEPEHDDGRAAFGRGQVLFAMQSSSQAPQFALAVEQGARFTWGLAPVPYDGDRPIQNVYGASLAVCTSTPAKQLAAWLFIRWFTQPEQQDRWVTGSHYFPVRRSIAHRLSSYYRASYELLEHGKPEPAIGGYEPVRSLMVESMQRILGGADMDAELKQLERQATATIHVPE